MDETDVILGRRNIYINEWSEDLEGMEHFETQYQMEDDFKTGLEKYGFLKCEMDLSGSRHDRVARSCELQDTKEAHYLKH